MSVDGEDQMARTAATHFLATSFLLTSVNTMEFVVETSYASVALGKIAPRSLIKRTSQGM